MAEDIRLTAELQAATRKYLNRLVAIADQFGKDRDEIVFREVEALVMAIEGTSFEEFDVECEDEGM